MLDDMDCPYNYKHLASQLGISGGTLRTFKYGDSSESPSMIVLKILESQKPNLSTADMVVALTSWGPETIVEELKRQPPGGWIACSISNSNIYTSFQLPVLVFKNFSTTSWWLNHSALFHISPASILLLSSLKYKCANTIIKLPQFTAILHLQKPWLRNIYLVSQSISANYLDCFKI